jgi:hypothetical protein
MVHDQVCSNVILHDLFVSDRFALDRILPCVNAPDALLRKAMFEVGLSELVVSLRLDAQRLPKSVRAFIEKL